MKTDEEAAAPVTPGERRRVADGVYLLANPIGFPPGTQNAFLLADKAEDGEPVWTLVDPGFPDAEDAVRRHIGALAEEAENAGRRRVARVIATHHHHDHIGGAAAFMASDRAELLTTRTAYLYARMMQLDAGGEPDEAAARFYRRAGFDADQIEAWRARMRARAGHLSQPLPPGFTRLREGDSLDIGRRSWRVLIGHGHAPEHLLLHWPGGGGGGEAGLLLAGDQILPRISPNISVYPVEPNADPLGDWMESCRRFAEAFEDAPETLVLPGHGDPLRDPSARLRRILSKHESALERLEAWLRQEPRRAIDCFPPLFRRSVPPEHEGLAIGETLSHLHRLLAEGRAVRREAETGEAVMFSAA